MPLTIDEVTRIAHGAARSVSDALEVAGVTFGGSPDSDYVEILVNIRGCRTSPCRVEIGAFRDAPEPLLRDEIARKLRDHVVDHRSA